MDGVWDLQTYGSNTPYFYSPIEDFLARIASLSLNLQRESLQTARILTARATVCAQSPLEEQDKDGHSNACSGVITHYKV